MPEGLDAAAAAPQTGAVRRAPLLLLALLAASAQAQPASLRGTVRDAAGAALPGASVYLSGTSRGAAADAEGRYRIDGVPPGAYRLVGSMVGFEADVLAVRLEPGEARSVDLALEAAPLDLGDVVAEADRDARWQGRLAWFTRTLLGESANADSTRLLNPEVLDLSVRWGTLHAAAAAPLVIENRALGYRIHYDLSVFAAGASSVRYDGDERFEPLGPASADEAARWAAARLRAYRGSLTHLLQALLAGTTEAEGFSLEWFREGATGAWPSVRVVGGRLMDVDADGWGTLRARGRVEVVYHGEPEEAAYLRSEWFRERRYRPDPVQRSALYLDRSAVRVDPQGTPEDPFSISTSGHMAFERLADRVPEEYRPPPARDAGRP